MKSHSPHTAPVTSHWNRVASEVSTSLFFVAASEAALYTEADCAPVADFSLKSNVWRSSSICVFVCG
eukprot:s379_g38.t1